MSEFSAAYIEFLQADLRYWKVLVSELGLSTALEFRDNINSHSLLSAALRNDYRLAYNRMIELYKQR